VHSPLSSNLPPVAEASVSAIVVVSLLLSRSSAIRASLRLVFESLFFVEFLLAFRKNKFAVAILANQCFVCHLNIPP